MALTMRPERNVKLTKQDRNKVAKKIKRGWKSKVMIPDYKLTDDNSLTIQSDKIRTSIKIVKVLDDCILIEKAIDGKKNIKITWDRIAFIQNSRDLKDGLNISIVDGTNIEFSVYSSFKIDQTKDYIINYVNQKKLDNNSNLQIHN
ncbi:hypothetical protein [Methanobrevibacter sp. DSM 116169]|uniref:hypothetical protein n=1 Tax=Methanobrevibacter sp. DSM 116169 TaxID=3242727 RepID=UPI0038FCF44B